MASNKSLAGKIGCALLPIAIGISFLSAPVEAKKCWSLSKSCLKKRAGEIVTIAVPTTLVVDVATGEKPGTTGKRIGAETVRAIKNTSAEGRRAGRNTQNAAKAIGHYIDRSARAHRDAFEEAAHMARRGKIVDAIWHATTDPIKGQEEAAARAVQESSLLNAVASTAASVYGGPGGSAAYAAWFAYKASGGDMDIALKAGVLAGATTAGMGGIQKLPANSISDVARKTIIAGAFGGLTVAAAGGDEEALKEGFLRGGGMILVQEGYKAAVGAPLDGKSASGEPYCMATVNAECSPPDAAYVKDSSGRILDQNGNVFDPDGDVLPQVDVRKTDLSRPHVGTWAKAGERGITTEASPAMQSIAKIPGMNSMAALHDHWSVSWDMNRLSTVASIVPATVVTYYGLDSSLTTKVTKAAVEGAGGSVQAADAGDIPSIAPISPTAAGTTDVPGSEEVAATATGTTDVPGSGEVAATATGTTDVPSSGEVAATAAGAADSGEAASPTATSPSMPSVKRKGVCVIQQMRLTSGEFGLTIPTIKIDTDDMDSCPPPIWSITSQ